MTHSRATSFGCLLLGGLLALVASAQAWWRVADNGATVAFTGSETSGGLSQALALVALAGTLLVLVLQARGRRVVAVLLGLAGLGALVVGAVRLRPGEDVVRTKVRQVSLSDSFALTPTAWPWLFAAAGLLVLAGATLLWFGAPRWVRGADRFARPSASNELTADEAPTADDDPAVVWRALDAGLDPTVGHGDGAFGAADHPDAGERASRGHNGGKD